jgi:hypothetical protein
MGNNIGRGCAAVKPMGATGRAERVIRPPDATALRLLILKRSFFARRKKRLHFGDFSVDEGMIDLR